MITTSTDLQEEILSASQTVRPKVIARLADNRFLDNLKWASSSELVTDQIDRLDPEIFMKFDDMDYDAYVAVEKNTQDSGKGKFSSTKFYSCYRAAPASAYTKTYPTIQDTFNRGNSTSTLGLFDTGEDAQYRSWIQVGSGLWGINGNEAYISSFDDNTNYVPAMALVDSYGTHGTIEFTLGAASIDNQGIVIFAKPTDGLYGVYEFFSFVISNTFSSSGFVYGSNEVGGSLTTGIDTTPQTYADGNVITIEYVLTDTYNIKVYKNGVLVHDYDMPQSVFSVDWSSYVGLYCNNQGSATSARWDDFSVSGYDTDGFGILIDAGAGYVKTQKTENIVQFNDFSLGMWMKVDSLSANEVIGGYYINDLATERFEIGVNGSAVKIRLYDEFNTGTWYESNAGALALSEWAFVLFVKSGENLTIYADGDIVGEFTPVTDQIFFNAGATSEELYFAPTTNDLYLDNVFLTTDIVTQKQAEAMHSACLNSGSFSNTNFSAEQAVNGVVEETFSWAICDDIDEWGDVIVTNGEYKIVNDQYRVDDEYGWVSRSESNGSGDFVDPEFVWYEFDERKVNKLIFSTGFTSSRLHEVDYTLVLSDNTEVSGTGTFVEGESILEVALADDYDVIALKVQMVSTWEPNSLGRLHEVNVVYDVDVSDDVMSMGITKIRDDYESTLPIGLTAANNGSIVLNNTEKKYNPYGSYPYAPYISSDTEFFISLIYELSNGTEEEIKLADSVFAESWNISADSMSVDVPLSDYSKYLQEITPSNGAVWRNVTGGKAIAETAMNAGVAKRKCIFAEPYYRTILTDRPYAYWRMANTGTAFVDEGGNYDLAPIGTDYQRGIEAIIPQEQNSFIYRTDRNSELTEDPNKRIARALRFDGGTATNAYASGYTPDPVFTYDFAIEATFKPLAPPASYHFIAGDDFPSGEPVVCLVTELDGSDYFIRAYTYNGTTQYYAEHGPLTTAELVDTTFHAVATRDGSNLMLYIDGELVDTVAVTASANAVTGTWSVGGSETADGGSFHTFEGVISGVSIWSHALSADVVSEHYTASQLDTFYIFPYLYYNEETPWEAMLNFATADVGMFYFDEDGFLNYEYRNTFHENINTRHTQSQYTFSDSTNIIGGNQLVDIQTNRVIVVVNPLVLLNDGYDSVWRAEGGESLAVTELTDSFTPSSTQIAILDSNDPLWPDSGYVKIDDEIVQYGSRTENILMNLTRNLFGTPSANALTGALVREARVYNIEYSDAPVLNIKYPFLTAIEFDETADIDRFVTTPFNAEIVVSAKDSPDTAEGDLVILEGTNPVTEINNYFSIAGIPLKKSESKEKVIEEVRTISTNVRKFRIKELTIDNEFIQDKDYAATIANYLVKFFGTPVPVLDIEIMGTPQLQLGDLITISAFDQLDITNKMYWVIESSLEYDGGIHHNLKLREYSEGISE